MKSPPHRHMLREALGQLLGDGHPRRPADLVVSELQASKHTLAASVSVPLPMKRGEQGSLTPGWGEGGADGVGCKAHQLGGREAEGVGDRVLAPDGRADLHRVVGA